MSEEALPDKPRREPQQKGDEDVNLLIRKTLLRPDVAGNISVCAKLLGLTYGRVEGRVSADPWLSAFCPEKNASKMVPTETDIIDRDVPSGDEEAIRRLAIENGHIAKEGWDGIGLSDERALTLSRSERRMRMPLYKLIDSAAGGLIGVIADSEALMEKLGDQLTNGATSKYGPLPTITDMAGSDKTFVEHMKAYKAQIDTHISVVNMLVRLGAAKLDAMKKLKDLKADRPREQKGVFKVDTPKTDAT